MRSAPTLRDSYFKKSHSPSARGRKAKPCSAEIAGCTVDPPPLRPLGTQEKKEMGNIRKTGTPVLKHMNGRSLKGEIYIFTFLKIHGIESLTGQDRNKRYPGIDGHPDDHAVIHNISDRSLERISCT